MQLFTFNCQLKVLTASSILRDWTAMATVTGLHGTRHEIKKSNATTQNKKAKKHETCKFLWQKVRGRSALRGKAYETCGSWPPHGRCPLGCSLKIDFEFLIQISRTPRRRFLPLKQSAPRSLTLG